MDAPEESAQRAPCRYCGEPHPASFSHCPKTGRSLHAGRALIGRVIADRYRVLGVIGEGGMGAVYVAEHLLIGRKVALKRLHPELTGDAKAVARFQREARAAAATGHEHIVEVIDLGFGEDGAPFLVMEYLRGGSLAEVLRKDGKLEPRRACRIVGQLLAALSAVHRLSIVHRDLKPDNLILTHRRGDRDFVKVVDFGISKMQKEEGEGGLALTRTGVMLGTPFYMSPEQARGVKGIDHRVDLYGAGVILYECLAGRLPFDGDNYHQLLQAILAGKHPNVRELRPELSEDLAAVVERAMALEPSARYASAREMLLALVPHGAIDPGVGESAPPPRPLEAIEDEAKTTPISSVTSEADYAATTPMPVRTVGYGRTEAVREPPPQAPVGRPRASAPRGLAPEPRAVEGPPRRFVAQSPDWDPHPHDGHRADGHAHRALDIRSLRESPAPFSREDSGARPVDPPMSISMVTPSETGSDPTRVKGSLMITALETLRRTPGDLERVLARLDASVGAQLTRVILPMAWLPLTAYVELLRAAERELGASDGMLAVRIGKATADRELTSTHRLFMQGASPAMAAERIPQLFRAYHGPGRAEIERSVAGSYRVSTHGVSPDTHAHALAMSGFYQRLIELAGGQDVRAAVVACRERGDEQTITSLRWR